jgi:hypothetical protein
MTATCACGQASITVSAPPTLHGICHCTNCKRRTGSAFGISAYFERLAVTHQVGETQVYGFHHKELNHEQERHFCIKCGTTLFWFVSSMPEKIGIAAGCFESGALPDPGASYRHNKREAWLELPETWSVFNE